MEIEEIVNTEPNESEELEYKRKEKDERGVVQDLTALANTNGGELFYGIGYGDGEITEIQDIDNFEEKEEAISQIIANRTDPRLNSEIQEIEYQRSILMKIDVTHQNVLHTYRPQSNKPFIPRRIGSTTDYWSGGGIREFYSFQISQHNKNIEQWLDDVWKKAHRVVYQYSECSFENREGRSAFVEHIQDSVIEDKLTEPHQEADEKTKDTMKSFVDTATEITDFQTSATPNVNLSGLISGKRQSSPEEDYIGDSPDEVERKFRSKAEEVKQEAENLKDTLSI
jgi:predicted HTH transcriptional regulator